jgi:hypothetical protein
MKAEENQLLGSIQLAANFFLPHLSSSTLVQLVPIGKYSHRLIKRKVKNPSLSHLEFSPFDARVLRVSCCDLIRVIAQKRSIFPFEPRLTGKISKRFPLLGFAMLRKEKSQS